MLATVPPHATGGDLGNHRETDVEPETGFPIPHMAPGDLVAFDRNTLHRSVKNGELFSDRRPADQIELLVPMPAVAPPAREVYAARLEVTLVLGHALANSAHCG
jgi:hypothetical protein